MSGPPVDTPWGRADSTRKIVEGIWEIETPSHGGLWLSPVMNSQVPAEWRAISFNGQAERGWYEEDCDWSMVVLTFPDHFAKHRKTAQGVFDAFHKPKLKTA